MLMEKRFIQKDKKEFWILNDGSERKIPKLERMQSLCDQFHTLVGQKNSLYTYYEMKKTDKA
jgi:hypothetical protein